MKGRLRFDSKVGIYRVRDREVKPGDLLRGPDDATFLEVRQSGQTGKLCLRGGNSGVTLYPLSLYTGTVVEVQD